jgi:ABC-type antimicrobial peptide transport system permease subunit
VEGASPLPWVKPLVAALAHVHPDAIVTVKPLAADVEAMLVQERMVAGLATLFAVIAVLLAGLGLYGLTSYAVGRRRSEIGIRIALGASPADVVALVMRRTSVLIGLGAAFGAVVSWWSSALVSPLLFGLEPRDPATFVAAFASVAGLGLLAAWLAARRAAGIDPSEALNS